jgi:hypothetical protein
MIPNAPIYKGIKNYNDGDNKDLRKQIMDVTPEAVAQMRGSAKYFKGKTDKETCQNIWNFLKKNIRYEADGEYQIVRLPSALLATRVGDCKSFSVFTSAVLTNLGIPNHYMMTSYSKDPTPSHIYVMTDSGIICDAVWNQFNAEKTPTYRYKAKPNNMNNKGLGGGCTAMGATLSVPKFKVGMNGSSVPSFKVGMGNCGCSKCKGMGSCNCGCGMGYPGGQGMGASGKYTLSVPRQVILGIFSLNVGGLATLLQNKGDMNRVDEAWKKIGGDTAAIRAAIKDGSSKPEKLKWFGRGIKNRIIASVNEAIAKQKGMGATDAAPTTEAELIKEGETAKSTPYSVSVGDVTAIALSDTTKDEKNKQYLKLGLSAVSTTLCSGDPTQVVKALCAVLGYISGDLLGGLYDMIKHAFAKDIADESQANAAAELASQKAVVDLVESFSAKIGENVSVSVVTKSDSNVFGGGGEKVETKTYVYTKEMAEKFLTEQYYKASASAKPYMIEALKAKNLCKAIWGNIGGGGGAKLAGGGLLMGAFALAGLILVSSMGKKGKK